MASLQQIGTCSKELPYFEASISSVPSANCHAVENEIAEQASKSTSKPVQGPRGSKQRQRMLDRAEVWAKGEWTEDSPAAAPAAARGSTADDSSEVASIRLNGVAADDRDPSITSNKDAAPSNAATSQLDTPDMPSSSKGGSGALPDADASQAEKQLQPQSSEGTSVSRGRKRRPRPIARRT